MDSRSTEADCCHRFVDLRPLTVYMNEAALVDICLNGKTKNEIPHLNEMRDTSEIADQSGTDLGISHVVKRFRNALEVKAHAAQGMPKMSLQEKECKVEVCIGQPSSG